MRPRQDEIFVTSEGDNWFERNKKVLEGFDPEADLPLKLLRLYDLRPGRVLEVGAANGFRLAAIHERHPCRVVALEVSTKAIQDGKSRFRSVEFVQGAAHAIPLQEVFELIVVNFVFHWIDRANLLRCVSEIDRTLEDGGFLLIGDFHPSNLTKVGYHHLPEEEVFTYKQNYAATFLASGLYHLVGLITGNHTSKSVTADAGEHERIGVWLLRKMLGEHYAESVFSPDERGDSQRRGNGAMPGRC